MSEPRPYAVYWSIYTDLPGRRLFKLLYWDRLKDLIGRPAKIYGVEREKLWLSGLPSNELRYHVWHFFCAHNDEEAIGEMLRASARIAPEWTIFNGPTIHTPTDQDCESEDVLELIWYRDSGRYPRQTELPLPRLSTIMISLKRDTGFEIGKGDTVRQRSDGQRPTARLTLSARHDRGSYRIMWKMQVQTSTKRELMETHWPIIRQQFGGDCVQMVELEKRSGDVGPFKFSVQQDFDNLTDDEMISRVLSHCGGMNVWLEVVPEGTIAAFRGVQRAPVPANARVALEFSAMPKRMDGGAPPE
jgi:hypothetical protein